MKHLKEILAIAAALVVVAGCKSTPKSGPARLTLESAQLADGRNGALTVDEIFYETSEGRFAVRSAPLNIGRGKSTSTGRGVMADGRTVEMIVTAEADVFKIQMRASPAEGIIRWGFAMDARRDEYFTGLMERTVDGPQQASWAPGIKPAMNLRGQKVDMFLKPTTSVYAPFYLSSHGYGLFVKTDWPGKYDFCVTDPKRVLVEFEGPELAFKIYTATNPVALVQSHARDAGLPFLPPKWTYTPWRWRDEHKQRTNYYDGAPVTGPFNAEVMEDVLMMKAFGIPCGLYWIDRPWAKGKNGYDDFEIDPERLPNFGASVKWLEAQNMKTMLWIGPFFQGAMETNALANGFCLPGQLPQKNNYPMVDFSNPDSRKYWQDGVSKLLKLGVAGFKLDRAEEQMPEKGPFKIFDGRSIREQRNNYPVMYLQAAHDVAKEHRGNDFVCMPRAAYTGSSPLGIFWGGDVGGVPEGLRASIIGVQRAAVMGYPNWGSDICGYGRATLEQELCMRWLAFGCFTPIMEVGPTKNLGFWNLPREPKYDTNVIAAWRLYARLHQRLVNYSYAHAVEASKSGMPIVRPLFLVDSKAPEAWENWWTYQYGRDLVVSPIWKTGQRTQKIYLPSGEQWRDAWNPEKIYPGGRTITMNVEVHQIPIFIRVGSNVELGDLNQEWQESLAVAAKKPNLAALEAGVKAWFERNK